MGKPQKVPVTRDVLLWAIEESGFSAADIAKAIHATSSEMNAWTSGRDTPTLSQARKLAHAVGRQLATLLLPARPSTSAPSIAFRHPPKFRTKLNPRELRWLREATRLQRGLSWVSREINEAPPDLLSFKFATDAEIAGSQARTSMFGERLRRAPGFDTARGAFEERGIAVFVLPLGRDGCRGFSLWDERVPVVAVNSAYNVHARTFTLFHEYAHLATNTNSACLGFVRSARSQGDPIERWCERFAAAALMPTSLVEYTLETELSWKPGERLDSLDELQLVARRMNVSVRAAALRLIEKQIAGWTLYKKIPVFSDTEKEGGGGGSGRNVGDVRKSQYGEFTCSLFVRAVRRDALTRSDVESYMNAPPGFIDELVGLPQS